MKSKKKDILVKPRKYPCLMCDEFKQTVWLVKDDSHGAIVFDHGDALLGRLALQLKTENLFMFKGSITLSND